MNHLTQIAQRLTSYNAVIRSQKNVFIESQSLSEDDSRITFYEKVAVTLDDARIGLYLGGSGFIENAKNDDQLRALIYEDANIDTDYYEYLIKNYETSISRLLILSLHQSIESSLRLLEGGSGGLASIYKAFLDNTSLNKKDQYHSLLEIIRTLRNSVHNNGIYQDPNHTTFNKTYGALIVNLTRGDKVNISWSDIEIITEGVKDLLQDLANDSYFTTQLSYIKDPTY